MPLYTKDYLQNLSKWELVLIASSFEISNVNSSSKVKIVKEIFKQNWSKLSNVTYVDKLLLELIQQIYYYIFKSKYKCYTSSNGGRSYSWLNN